MKRFSRLLALFTVLFVTTTRTGAEDTMPTGEWHTKKMGCDKTIIHHQDGTAVLEVTFGTFARIRYGGKGVTVNLTWTRSGNVVSYAIEDGTPRVNINRLKSDFEDKLRFHIMEENADRIVLVDNPEDPSIKTVWVSEPLP